MIEFPKLGTTNQKHFAFYCSQCHRRGRYRLGTLLAEFGPDMMVPDLPKAVARWRGCTRVDNEPWISALACGAIFDLWTPLTQENELEKARKNWR